MNPAIQQNIDYDPVEFYAWPIAMCVVAAILITVDISAGSGENWPYILLVFVLAVVTAYCMPRYCPRYDPLNIIERVLKYLFGSE